MAFSLDVKEELLQIEAQDPCCQHAEPLAALALTARITPQDISLNTAQAGYATRWAAQIAVLAGAEPAITRESGHYQVRLAEPSACQRLLAQLARHGLDPATRAFPTHVFAAACCRRAALRGLFLAGGSLGEPVRGYHLEIISRYPAAATGAARLLRAEGILPRQSRRSPFHVVYIKDGGQVADFLRATGAHVALLSFESLRVEKDMRNAVNRMVNCDTANSTRVAYAAARQLELLRTLRADPHAMASLPPDLAETAQLRLAYPGLSIRELGERLDPPIGKSGMSHRLRRLEQVARDWASRRPRPLAGRRIVRADEATRRRESNT